MPPHYKRSILLSIIERRLPSGSEAWKVVCQEYKEESGEVLLRDYEDVRRHFLKSFVTKTRNPQVRAERRMTSFFQPKKLSSKYFKQMK